MSQQPTPYTRPTSSGGLVLRGILLTAVVVLGIVGAVWYANR